MNNQSIETEISQGIRIPYFGEAIVERNTVRPYWLPFFHCNVARTDSTYNQHGELGGGAGDIVGFTLRIGRWQVIVDRPRVEITGTTKDPLTWNQTAWLTIGAPAVVLSVIAAGLVGRLFTRFIAKPLGWTRESRADLLPEL